MALVNFLNVEILDNPAPFGNPVQLEITFECIAQLEDADSAENDLELDSIMVGPVPIGVNKFVFQAPPPHPDKIPATDAVGVTVLLLTCSYFGREFVKVGYYVNNEYDSEELRNEMPEKPMFERLVRSILADKPRVTRFPIAWTKELPPPELPPVEGNPDQEPAEMEITMNDVQMTE